MHREQTNPQTRMRPWRTLAACLAIGLVAFVLPAGTGVPAREGEWPAVAGLAVLLGGWAYFGAWTWRRLARLRDGQNGRMVYGFGVLGFGLTWGAGMAIHQAVEHVGGMAGIPSAAFAGELFIQSVIHFPLALWAGYLWGRTMGLVFELPPRNGHAAPGHDAAGPDVV